MPIIRAAIKIIFSLFLFCGITLQSVYAADAPLADWSVARPFSDYEKTGYVVISLATMDFEISGLFEAVAKNLPDGVSIIVTVPSLEQAQLVQKWVVENKYTDLSKAGRIQFLQLTSGFSDPIGVVWERDDLPFPVVMKDSTYGLVSSLYFDNRKFVSGPAVAAALSLPSTQTGQHFRGGNLAVDGAGNCFSEKTNEVAAMKDPIGFFETFFGCATVTLLDQSGGIGDIDERVKFMGHQDVMTDDAGYSDILSKRGYKVHMIPRISNAPYETYMNTLLVNGTIFVPQMGTATDADALAAYRELGFTAVPVFTREMAEQGHGNIHCVTMNYPPGSFISNLKLP